jgi:hypothetical protein
MAAAVITFIRAERIIGGSCRGISRAATFRGSGEPRQPVAPGPALERAIDGLAALGYPFVKASGKEVIKWQL